jgi:hypothetical protein
MSNTVSPITGNQYFSVVKNLEVDPTHLLKGVESVVTALQVPGDNGALPVATGVATTVVLSNEQLDSFLTPGFLLTDVSGLTSPVLLSLGADTAVRAAELIRLLKLNQNTPSRLLKFEQTGGATAAGFAASLGNSTGTSLYVKVCVAGGAPSGSVSLFPASSVGNAYVVVSLTSPATTQPITDPAILFNVVQTPS